MAPAPRDARRPATLRRSGRSAPILPPFPAAFPVRILVRLTLWTWFLGALVVGRLELLARLPAWGLAGIPAGLILLLLAAGLGSRALRGWIATLDLRLLVLLHAVRFYGVYCLVLYQRGTLTYALAVPGGWSDISVALLALAAVFLPLREELHRQAVIIWNTIGVTGLLLNAATAGRIGLAQPWQLDAFRRLPLSVLPTFLVPLLLATHVIIFARLLREPPETARPA